MPIRYEGHITRAMLRAEPDTLWMFGDNIAETGFGGQATEMRGEPNAVGIPTKHLPQRVEKAFFRDCDHRLFWKHALPRFSRLREHLEAGGTVVVPKAGIGTGLAQLEFRAPYIWADLQRTMRRLQAIAEAASGTDAQRAEARSGSVEDEGPAPSGETPSQSPDPLSQTVAPSPAPRGEETA